MQPYPRIGNRKLTLRQALPLISAIAFIQTSSNAHAEDNAWTIRATAGVAAFHRDNDLDQNQNNFRPALEVGIERKSTHNLKISSSVQALLKGPDELSPSGNLFNWKVVGLHYDVNTSLQLNASGMISMYARERNGWGYGMSAGASYFITQDVSLDLEAAITNTDISVAPDPDYSLNAKDDFHWLALSLSYRF